MQELLEDKDIIKVGVAPLGDANYLQNDYGISVASTMDLRYLAAQCQHQTAGLAALSEKHLKVRLNKSGHLVRSNWEADVLTEWQIEYAARDAHVAIELFKLFAEQLKPRPFWMNTKDHLDQFRDQHCVSYLDFRFKECHALAVGASNAPIDIKMNVKPMCVCLITPASARIFL